MGADSFAADKVMSMIRLRWRKRRLKCACAVSHDLSASDLIGRNNVMSGVAHANVGQMSRDPGLS